MRKTPSRLNKKKLHVQAGNMLLFYWGAVYTYAD